jgi:hypothetical protein
MTKDKSTIRVVVELDLATIYQARKDYQAISGKKKIPNTRKSAKLIAQDLIDRYCGTEWINPEILG